MFSFSSSSKAHSFKEILPTPLRCQNFYSKTTEMNEPTYFQGSVSKTLWGICLPDPEADELWRAIGSIGFFAWTALMNGVGGNPFLSLHVPTCSSDSGWCWALQGPQPGHGEMPKQVVGRRLDLGVPPHLQLLNSGSFQSVFISSCGHAV